VADLPLLPESTPWPAWRIRRLGALILVASVLAAGAIYWSESRSGEISEGQILAGFDRQRNHDMGVLYGRGGRDLMNALEAVDSPPGHAILALGAGIIGAWTCFSRARVIEDDKRP
jgi:hypothetical protein